MPPTASPSPLLDPEFIRQLERLSLATRRIWAGATQGERRSRRKGISIEFADYRNYVPGDDIRFVDWKTYGRLDRLFLKLFLEEEDLHLYLLVDDSASMAYGTPEKGLQARRLAAALAYIALHGGDRVAVGLLSDGLRAFHGPVRGRPAFWPLVRFLEAAVCDGETHLATAFRTFALRRPRPGLAVVISDFLDKEGLEDAFRALLASGCETHAIHLLAPEELEPERVLKGDLRLVDLEDGDTAEVTVARPLLERYARTLDTFRGRVRRASHRRGIGYLFARTDTPLDRLLLQAIRSRGLVR